MRSIDGIEWVPDWPDQPGHYFIWHTTLNRPSLARVIKPVGGELVVMGDGRFYYRSEYEPGRYWFSETPVDIVGPLE